MNLVFISFVFFYNMWSNYWITVEKNCAALFVRISGEIQGKNCTPSYLLSCLCLNKIWFGCVVPRKCLTTTQLCMHCFLEEIPSEKAASYLLFPLVGPHISYLKNVFATKCSLSPIVKLNSIIHLHRVWIKYLNVKNIK